MVLLLNKGAVTTLVAWAVVLSIEPSLSGVSGNAFNSGIT
jgi:hypothetical protein